MDALGARCGKVDMSGWGGSEDAGGLEDEGREWDMSKPKETELLLVSKRISLAVIGSWKSKVILLSSCVIMGAFEFNFSLSPPISVCFLVLLPFLDIELELVKDAKLAIIFETELSCGIIWGLGVSLQFEFFRIVLMLL